jgi:hypothetical protein
VKDIVADLLVCAHGDNGLPCRLHGSAIDFAGCRTGIAGDSIGSIIFQPRPKRLPHELRAAPSRA